MKGIFITGCGTDVGKTMVTASLLKAALNQSITATVFKPVQTGCETVINPDGSEQNLLPDLDSVAEICLPNETERKILSNNYSYAYKPACSPHLAAKLACDEISFDRIRSDITKLEKDNELLLIEGAGGLMVPINETESFLDLILRVNYPTLIVTNNRLGCINEALLTISVLQNAGITPTGIVMNNTTPPTVEEEFIRNDNPKVITKFSSIPVIAELPYTADISAKNKDFWEKSSNQFTEFIQTII